MREPTRLIVILLRGAVDGLNVVIPYADGAYYQERQSIAVAPPGKPDGALALDGHFGLHPALASLMPLWTERRLAFVHAAGSPDPTRSHFDAQLYLENGTPGQDTTRDGWMNRLLLALPGPRGATDAISIGPTVPRILAGKAPVATLPLGPNGARPLPIDQPEIASAFDRLYSGNDDLARSYREGRTARAELIGALSTERQIADNGAPPPTGFPGQATRLALLIRRQPWPSALRQSGSEVGTPTSIRATTTGNWPIICARSARVSPPLPADRARRGATPSSSSCRNSAAPFGRTATGAPITATATSSG